MGLGGVAVGSVAGSPAAAAEPAAPGGLPSWGSARVSPHGAHQAGIETPVRAHVSFVALDLDHGVDREALVRLLRLLTGDIERLTDGRPALADPMQELADVPARLTITVGFGRDSLEAAGLADEAPRWLAEGLPTFSVDRLDRRWSGGDLVLQVASDDPVTVSHATRVLVTDAAPFASVRWVQSGFHRSPGTTPAGSTGRNLMGQVDGTVNPEPGTADFDTVVWAQAGADVPAWLVGGTALVIRRIAMDLRAWGALDRAAKEQSVGRRLSDGAPLTGGDERTAPDYQAVNAHGFPVIPATSHIRLAHPGVPVERILRRPYNYDAGIGSDGAADAGLLFVACMADPVTQFVPIQRRLAAADTLNIWTTPIGSALFAVPPGFQPGQHVGHQLLGT